MGKNREDLFALDKNLHTEADRMLRETDLGEIIHEAGYKPVGSYVMNTMTAANLYPIMDCIGGFNSTTRMAVLSGKSICGQPVSQNGNQFYPSDSCGRVN